MYVEQKYTSCLAQGAYYIEHNGEAVVIDPLREVSPYVTLAKSRNAKIKYIFETHFHADFVSGHLSLAKETGAPIVYGPKANPDFEFISARDGDIFEVGDLKIKVLHTPGHTMESTCYLLYDEEGLEHSLFTGDTLFLGDVGRPDLAQDIAGLTPELLAETLYDSLRNKIWPLPDHVIVYPAHGAGSSCGKNMMNITQDTLGNQKKVNYALAKDLSQSDFVTQLLDGLAAPPAYFPINVALNQQGYDHLDDIMKKAKVALDPTTFQLAMEDEDTMVLDVRNRNQFATSHIPGSLFIGLDGSFAPWVGEIIVDVKKKLLLVCDEPKVEEAITRLSRVGFDQVVGYLKGGMDAWVNSGRSHASITSISASVFDKEYTTEHVYDVRRASEFDAQHVKDAELTPLSELAMHLEKYNHTQPKIVHCAGGYRSMIACSILQAKGVKGLINIEGGFGAIKKTNLPLSEVSSCGMSKV